MLFKSHLPFSDLPSGRRRYSQFVSESSFSNNLPSPSLFLPEKLVNKWNIARLYLADDVKVGLKENRRFERSAIFFDEIKINGRSTFGVLRVNHHCLFYVSYRSSNWRDLPRACWSTSPVDSRRSIGRIPSFRPFCLVRGSRRSLLGLGPRNLHSLPLWQGLSDVR